MSTGLQIKNLANHPHYLVPLSKWYHQSFSHLTGELTLEQRRQNLSEHIKGKPLPTSFIAIRNKRLLGGLCLVENDIESYMGYTPWLSRIFIHPEARGQSVAAGLINHAVTYTRNLGHENLYLLTEHQQLFFSRMGFEEIEKASLNDFPVSIMVLYLDKTLRLP